MQTEQIVALLIQERNRLDAAIHALQGSVKRRGRPTGSGRKKATDGFDYNAPSVPDWVKPASAKASVEAAAPKIRKLSAAGRKAIAEAAKKRWAAIREAKASEKAVAATPKEAVQTPVAKKKASVNRGAAYRKMMSEKMKAAWAKRKKAA